MEEKIKRPKSVVSRYKLLTAFLMFVVCSFTVSAQDNVVTGTVKGEDGEPVAGANVVEKGTSNATLTDFDGNYSIKLKSVNKVLTVEYLGYESAEVSAKNKKNIVISLRKSTEDLEEVVLIGYGAVKKKDVIGAVGSVKSEAIQQAAPVSALDGVEGRIAGVQITPGSSPGESADITIRGISTFGAGTSPLYVVDGQQVDDIDNINPADIETIDVLKDGASAAIYGSRSVNGVILITTKQGKPGYPRLKVDYIRSASILASKIPVSNTRQYNVFRALRSPTGTNATGQVADSLGIRNQIVEDAQEAIKRIGIKNQVNIGVSGGDKSTKYYWNNSYLEDNGIIISSSYKRITSNLRLDSKLNKSIKAGIRINNSYSLRNGLNEGRTFYQLAIRRPDVALIDFDGSFIREKYRIANPIANATLATNDTRELRSSIFNYIDINIFDGLKFKTTLGLNYRNQKLSEFNPQATVDVDRAKINGRERQRNYIDYQSESYFTYTKSFKDHNVNALLGMSVQKWTREFSDLRAIEFNNDYIPTFNNVKEFNLDNTGTTETSNALSSVYGRLQYNYKGKYLVSGSLRRDGSSRFGANRRWGNFPAAQVGWQVAKEKFMKPIKSVLNEFKIRASYAITGNERIGDFESVALYDPGNFYNSVSGIAPSQLGNNDLGWEETTQENYGVDLSFFRNKFSISVDRYIKTTDDLLYSVPIPEETGFNTIRTNIGSVQNKGWDVSISGTPVKTKNFTWNTAFNVSYNENKVLKLADEDGFENNGYIIREGESVGNMYGYKNLGVFRYDQSNAFTADGVQLTPNFDENGTFVNHTLNGEEYTGDVSQLRFQNRVLRGGDYIFQDQNGDFNIEASNDRVVIGNGLADFVGGFTNTFRYKSLSMSFLLNFNFGNDIYRWYDWNRNRGASSNQPPHPDRIDQAWKQQGDITVYPILHSNRPQNRTGYQSQYVSEADYIQLSNVRLNYTVPKKILKKIGIVKSLKFTASANNLFMFTNYEGYNPKLGRRGDPLRPGWDGLRYPNKREFIFGLNAQF
ncbi:SusC/RagA family TonB-linked outer membrane protein [Wenyingzhuangia sp. IMCC45574]